MSASSHAEENLRSVRNPAKRPDVPAGAMDSQIGREALTTEAPTSLLSLASRDAPLSRASLQTAQREKTAIAINQMRGNRHLQRMLTQSRPAHSKPLRPLHPGRAQAVQLWRDIPSSSVAWDYQVEPDMESAWRNFELSAEQAAGDRRSRNALPELRLAYYNLISEKLRLGDLRPINVDARTTAGTNLHWIGTIRFVLDDQAWPPGASPGASFPGGASAMPSSGSSSSSKPPDSSTAGSSGVTRPAHSPPSASPPAEAEAAGGRSGRAGAVGEPASPTPEPSATPGGTSMARPPSEGVPGSIRYASFLGIEVFLRAESDLGSSWSDFINPGEVGGAISAGLTLGTGQEVTGRCGTVTYTQRG